VSLGAGDRGAACVDLKAVGTGLALAQAVQEAAAAAGWFEYLLAGQLVDVVEDVINDFLRRREILQVFRDGSALLFWGASSGVSGRTSP
jgi:hypothetical protein